MTILYTWHLYILWNLIIYPYTFIHLDISKPPWPTRTISFRKIRAIDQNCLAENIRETAILRHSAIELDAMVYQYNSPLRPILDKHSQLESNTFRVRQMIPWFPDQIEDAKQQLEKLERLWTRTRLTVHRQMYQAKKRLFGDLMNSDKVKYFNDKIVSCAGNQSTLFKTVD